MSEYDSKYLFNILNNINTNPDNIKTATNYIYYHRDNYKNVIFDMWKQFFFIPGNNNTTLLHLFYVLHEVLLVSTFKDKYDYIYLFASILNSIIDYLSIKLKDIKYLLKIKEIINVWQELMIFSNNYINELKNIITKNIVKLDEDDKIQDIISKLSIRDQGIETYNLFDLEKNILNKDYYFLNNKNNDKVLNLTNTELINKYYFSNVFKKESKHLDLILNNNISKDIFLSNLNSDNIKFMYNKINKDNISYKTNKKQSDKSISSLNKISTDENLSIHNNLDINNNRLISKFNNDLNKLKDLILADLAIKEKLIKNLIKEKINLKSEVYQTDSNEDNTMN